MNQTAQPAQPQPAQKPVQKSKKSFGPESDYLQRLKGKPVVIVLLRGAALHGKLVWVDRYSIGFRWSATINGVYQEREDMYWKAGIECIHAEGYECAPGDENAATSNRPSSAP